MEMHFRVRTVLRSSGSSALTLVPVEWFKESETETFTADDGMIYPALEPCEPGDADAEPDDQLFGSKAMTELRVQSDDMRFEPDDYITLIVKPSR